MFAVRPYTPEIVSRSGPILGTAHQCDLWSDFWAPKNRDFWVPVVEAIHSIKNAWEIPSSIRFFRTYG